MKSRRSYTLISQFYLLLLTFILAPGISARAEIAAIPFTYENHVPFVRVQSQNNMHAPMCFILDTGASTTVVGATTIRNLKLGYYKLNSTNDPQAAITCGMGNAPSAYIQGLRATCGELPLRSTALATDINNFRLSCARPVDGLLGTDFLRNKILTIQFSKRMLYVESLSGSDNGLAGIAERLPSDQHDAVFVKVSTPLSPRPLVFLVDTGTTHCTVDLKVAKRMNLALSTECELNVVGGMKAAYTAEKFIGSLDGHPLPSKVLVCDLSQASWSLVRNIDGILGMNFMENYTVKINFRTRKLNLL